MDFEHLVLLVGTNPLPNYVVAKYFLKYHQQLKSVWLIYTNETKVIAQRLRTVLKREHKDLNYHFCGLDDPGNPQLIRKNITGKLLNALDSTSKVHLNYTGGTKNMVVHAYFTIFEALEISNTSFSYLDARDFKLKSDDNLTPPTHDLRKDIAIEFNDLLALHGCSEENRGTILNWEAANTIMREFIEQGKLINYDEFWQNRKQSRKDFFSWKWEKVRTLFYEFGRLKKPVQPINLKDLFHDHPFSKDIKKLLAKFPKKQLWKFDSAGNLIIKDLARKFDRAKGDFVQGILYLDGFWLEYYVIELLEHKIEAENLKLKLLHNRRIKKEGAQKDFEIDIMLLNGYQLCGISITTDFKEGTCKQKAFEILHRSRQMGGDEARSILIAPVEKEIRTKIEDDLRFDIGGEPPFCIIGLEDFVPEKLEAKIISHIFKKN